MTEQYFIRQHERSWNQFEAMLTERGKDFSPKAESFPRLLRCISADLNTARVNGFDPQIVERLNRLVLDGNQKQNSVRNFSLYPVIKFLTVLFPASVRRHWKSFASCAFIFYGLNVFIMFVCIDNEQFTNSILPRNIRYQLEEMYNADKESVFYLKPREVTGDADMFAYYIYNNTSIAFQTFAGGILFGAGSLLILISNAVFLGAASGYIINMGYSETFFSFVAAHSAFELTGIVLSAQAGLLLGYSFFVTGGLSRSASLKKTGETVFPIIAGAAVLIFLAAIIESFWSSKHTIAPLYHYITGAAAALLLVLYFFCAGRGKA
jgi:uncharacterized membrane protein SpoIIM required for sporulation